MSFFASASFGSSCGFSYSSTSSPFDEVLHRPAAVHLDLGRHPHVAVDTSSTSSSCSACVNSLPFMTTCVPGEQMLPVVRFPLPSPPRNCASIDTGKSWSLRIVFGSWQWNITPLLRTCPARPALALLADEAVLDPQPVVRELVLVEQVAELAVELGVLVVAHLQDAVLDAERVGVVVAELVALDLRRPAVEVLAVEERHPLALVLLGLLREGGWDDADCQEAKKGQRSHVSLLVDETGDPVTVRHRSPGIRVQFGAGLGHFEVFFSAATQLQSSRLLIAPIGGSKRPRSSPEFSP